MPCSDIGGNMNKAWVGEPVHGSLKNFFVCRLRLIAENSAINLKSVDL